MENSEIEPIENPVSEMWELELKLRGIGYLIEQQGSDEAPPLPNEMAEIYKGVGMILTDIASDIHELRVSFEESNLKGAATESQKEFGP